MQLNFLTIIYLFFRLAPFIIVCFFTLQSVFNQDLKGFVYLVGLLIACFVSTMVGNLPGMKNISTIGQKNDLMCNFIQLKNDGFISNLPLGQTVLSFTFFYLFYIIVKYKLVNQNIATMILFPLLIIADFIWNFSHKCANVVMLGISFIIGGVIGLGWGYFIDYTGKVDLQLFNGISNKEVCSRPSRTIYRCRVRNGGTIPKTSNDDGYKLTKT
jgi:hypothetical protein